MHKISMKTIFKELIFTVVEGKNPAVCDSTDISVHVHLWDHAAERAELPAMLKVT